MNPIQSEGCGSVKVVKEFEKTVNECLNGGNRDDSASHLLSLKRPLEVMAACVTSTQSLLQAMTTDKSSKSFKKIPAQYQQMLLIASSIGQAIPKSLSEEALDFFSQSNSLHGQLKLNSLLESARLQVSVSPALAILLQSGCFLWSNVFIPSGLAASVLTADNVIRSRRTTL